MNDDEEDGRSARSGQDPFLEQIGERLREERERCGLSRRAVADRCNLSARFLVEVEHGRGNISILRLKTLAEALGVSLVELLGQSSGNARLRHTDVATTSTRRRGNVSHKIGESVA